jgi:adenosylcobinamide amidohydrolase
MTALPRHVLRPVLRAPWLLLDLGMPHQVAGWPVLGPSFGTARHLVWRQVRDADLPLGADPVTLLATLAEKDGIAADLGLLTAADVTRYAHVEEGTGELAVEAIATSGLGNGETVIAGPDAIATDEPAAHVGTINLVARLPRPLSFAGFLEAISIAAEARTAAVIGLDLRRKPTDPPFTGTGTDCIVIAAPFAGSTEKPSDHCGLHTTLGRFLGRAVYRAVREASLAWLSQEAAAGLLSCQDQPFGIPVTIKTEHGREIP